MTTPWRASHDPGGDPVVDPLVGAPVDVSDGAVVPAPVPAWPDLGQPVGPRNAWRREAWWALAVAAVVSLLGFPLGMLWSAITPKVEVVMTPQGVWYAQTRRFEEAVAADGWFVFLTAGAGAVMAIAVWLIARRYRGPVILLGLTVGSVACAVIAAWLGHRIGLAQYQRLAHSAAVGRHFFRPADLGTKRIGLWFGVLPWAQGAVLLQAAAAVSLYTMLAGFHRAPSLRDDDARSRPAPPVSSDWTAYPAPSAAPAPPVPGTATSPPD